MQISLKAMKCINCKHWEYTHTTLKKLGNCKAASKPNKPYAADFIQKPNEIQTWQNFGCIRFEDKRNFLQKFFNIKP